MLLNILMNIPLLHIHSAAVADGGFWHVLPSLLWEVLSTSLEITGLVLLMMALIDLVNVSSSGRLVEKLQHRPFLQLLLACLLGAIPGCAGGFAVVSLYAHNLLTFGALAGGMIATFGDEAFFLFVQSPKWGFIVTGILFALGIVVGTIVNLLLQRARKRVGTSQEIDTSFAEKHHAEGAHDLVIHDGVDHHEHSEAGSPGFKEKLRHFFVEHLWNHIVRQHFLTVFLWSFGVLLFLKVFGCFFDLDTLLQTHTWAKYLLLLIAVLIGFIPESGPHLVFIVMFLEGTIPFGVLLGNCIAQNGHAGLPLLAQSRRSFFMMKAVTVLLGLLCGAIML